MNLLVALLCLWVWGTIMSLATIVLIQSNQSLKRRYLQSEELLKQALKSIPEKKLRNDGEVK